MRRAERIMYTIGRLAQRLGVSADTLRYYEKQGLVAPASKSAAGYRLYTEDAARRLRFIQHAQQCGFTLAEIRELLELKRTDAACCQDVLGMAIEKKLRIAHKLRAMQAMSLALDELIERCPGGQAPTEDCAILAALERGIERVQR